MAVEIMVEYDSCDSGCGTAFFYGDNRAAAIRKACDDLALWCEPGDCYEALFIDTLTDRIIAEKFIKPLQ